MRFSAKGLVRIRARGPERSHARSAGVALVEFAIVLPIFAVMVFGLIDIGRIVYVNNAAAEGAREGSRYGSVAARSNTSSSRDLVRTWTLATMTAVPSPTVTITCQRDSVTVAACRSGDLLVVRITSVVEPMTPVIGQLVGALDLSAESRVRVLQ